MKRADLIWFEDTIRRIVREELRAALDARRDDPDDNTPTWGELSPYQRRAREELFAERAKSRFSPADEGKLSSGLTARELIDGVRAKRKRKNSLVLGDKPLEPEPDAADPSTIRVQKVLERFRRKSAGRREKK